VLIYDHQTESLWSQLKETAISGPMVGRRLKKISVERTAWKHWLKKHPQTKVLSTDTGYHRGYGIDPYEGYYRALGIMFPVGDVRTDLPAKEMVLGLEINGAPKAYPLSLLERKNGILKDEIGAYPFQIVLSQEGQVVNVQVHQASTIPVIFAYWFAWQAFHPGTEVYADAKQPLGLQCQGKLCALFLFNLQFDTGCSIFRFVLDRKHQDNFRAPDLNLKRFSGGFDV
jgi:hypothetical protein